MAKDTATYEKWVQEVAGKLPEDQKVAFAAITGTDVGKEIFGGYQREADYYKRLNQLAEEKKEAEAKQAQWLDWYDGARTDYTAAVADREALMAERDRLKAIAMGVSDTKPDSPPAEKTPDVNKAYKDQMDAIQKQLAYMDRALPILLADLSDVTAKVTREKWDVAPKAILSHALSKGVDLNSAFNELTSEERGKRFETDQAKLIKEAEDRGRREAMTSGRTPDNLRPGGPNIIETLRGSKPTDVRDRQSAAVSDWVEALNAGTVSN